MSPHKTAFHPPTLAEEQKKETLFMNVDANSVFVVCYDVRWAELDEII